MSLMIAATHEHSVIYKTSFIAAVDYKHNFIILINTVSLKIAVMLKSFFINIEFIVLSFI